MFNTPVEVPDRISTLELSRIWMYRALKELEQELQAGQVDPDQEPQTELEDEDEA